jgi:hypothetical protein
MPGPASAVPNGNAKNIFCLQFPVVAGSAFSAPTAVQRTYTVPGVIPGDMVYAIKPTFQSGLAVGGAQVTAANTVGITFVCTNGTPTLTAENFLLLVIRSDYDNPTTQLPTAIT